MWLGINHCHWQCHILIQHIHLQLPVHSPLIETVVSLLFSIYFKLIVDTNLPTGYVSDYDDDDECID